LSTEGGGLGTFDALVESNLDRVVADIQEFLRMPDDGDGLQAVAEFLARRLNDLGCSGVRLIPTSAHPMVIGRLDAGADRTLLVYLMYDRATVTDAPAWSSPPFEARVTEVAAGQAIVARGALARRGPLAAFLSTLELLNGASVRLPVNLVFIAEGDEVVGSPHLPSFYAEHHDLFADCSATLFPVAAQTEDGTIPLTLGAKGMLGIELSCSGAAWGRGPIEKDLHWADSAWVDSPMWRLTHVLSSLATERGDRILIDGFYDDVVPVSSQEQQLLSQVPFSADATKKSLGVRTFALDLDGIKAKQRELFEPCGVLEGCWASLPPMPRLYREAKARLDFRLLRNQTSEGVVRKLRSHLDARNFDDIEIRTLYAVPPSSVRSDDPVITAAVRSYQQMGVSAEIWPLHPRTPPPAVFERPYVMFGAGHGGNHSSTDEYLLVEGPGMCGLRELLGSYARFLLLFGDQ
jgi:acetylornithine deacetylase/succinyl-diaminopimelate desuccinylase-like protein